MMMGKSSFLMLFVAVVLIFSIGLIGCEEAPEEEVDPVEEVDPEEEVDPVEEVVIEDVTKTSYGPGTMAYSFSAGIAEAVEQVSGIRTRTIPGGNDMARVMPLRAGEAELTIFTGGTGFFVSRGADDFATEEWGPQTIRVAWRGSDLFVGCWTQGDSDILELSPEYIEGKTTVFMPGSPTITNINRGFVAFAGVDQEDVEFAEYPGHAAAGRAVIDRAVDFYNFGTTGDVPMEMEASPAGIRWLDLHPDDEEGWERARQYVPWTVPGLAERGAGLSEDNPAWTLRYPYNIWSYDHIADEIIYAYAEAIWNGYDIYKDTHAELPYWDHEAALDYTGNTTPFHDGLVQFLKDEGVWTDDHEKWQQAKLEREQARQDLWKEMFDEALEEGIDFRSDEWKDMWWDALEEAGLLTVYE